MPLLPPGHYRIEAKKEAFKTATASDVVVTVTEVTTHNLQLEVGSVQERIEVTGNAQVVQTESSALGRVTDEQAVENLPAIR